MVTSGGKKRALECFERTGTAGQKLGRLPLFLIWRRGRSPEGRETEDMRAATTTQTRVAMLDEDRTC